MLMTTTILPVSLISHYERLIDADVYPVVEGVLSLWGVCGYGCWASTDVAVRDGARAILMDGNPLHTAHIN